MSMTLVIIICIAALILGVIMAIIITNSILNQLGSDPAVIADIAEKISEGDFKINFMQTKKGFIGVYLSMKNHNTIISLFL